MELQEQARRLSASEKYRAHVQKHRRVIRLLAGIAIIQFVLYFLAIAWAPEVLGRTWPAGSAVSIVIWLTVLVVLLSIAISGVYIVWAGRFHDPEREEIIGELSGE